MIKPKASEVAKHFPTIMKYGQVRDEADYYEQITPSTTMTQNFEVAKNQL